MTADRLTELAAELQAIGDDELLAEGSLREALATDHWTAAHRAVDELREARERRAELEH